MTVADRGRHAVSAVAMLLAVGAAWPSPAPVAWVTAVQDSCVYLRAADGSGPPPEGSRLYVAHGGQRIGELIVEDGEPLHGRWAGDIVRGVPQVGDACHAEPTVASAVSPASDEAALPVLVGEARIAVISSLQDGVVYLRPAGSDPLQAGMRLSVFQGTGPVAVLVVREGEPLSAELVGSTEGVELRVGDRCGPVPAGLSMPPPLGERGATLPVWHPPRDATEKAEHRQGPPLGLSALGSTGIIRMPSAEVQPEGTGMVGLLKVPSGLAPSIPGNRDQEQYALGIYPRVEIGNTLAEYFGGWDITGHGKVQLLREGRALPAVAVGATELAANDLAGGSERTVFYGAATKHLAADRLRITLGYADRGLSGPYGGLEWALAPHLTLLGEYDTRRFNVGARLNPTRRTQASAALTEGGWSFQFAYGWAMRPTGEAPPPDVQLERPSGEDGNLAARLEALQASLVGAGFENVRTRIGQGTFGREAVVEYENRRYSHNELEALGRVMALGVASLPSLVRRLHVVIRKLDMPIATCVVDTEGYEGFLEGRVPPEEFARQLAVFPGDAQTSGEVLAATPQAASSRWRVDLTLRPSLQMEIGTEEVHVATGWALEPQVDTMLAEGLGVRVRTHWPIAGPLHDTDRFRAVDLADLSRSFWLTRNALARVHVGRFPDEMDGLFGEVAYTPQPGRHLLALSGGSFQRRFGGEVTGWDATVLGHYRYHFADEDTSVGVTLGRFLHADWGIAGSVRRDLGDTALRAEVAKSELGSRFGLWLDIPIGSGVAARPAAFRPRLPGHFQQGLLVGTRDSSSIDLTSAVAREADIGGNLLEDLLNRDRLSAGYVRAHLDELKRSGALALAVAAEAGSTAND